MSAGIQGARLPRTALMAWLVLFTTAWVSVAHAASVKWKQTTLTESDGSWKIDITIFLDKPPSVAHLPVRFAFTPTVVYERSLVDGKEGPQLTRLPLSGQQPLVESVDVGFLDPGSGTIQKRTKFSFLITREHGFEAGEYDVEIKTASNNARLGGNTRLTLQGDNAVVDRRSMVFEANDNNKKKKEEEKKRAEREAAEQNKKPTTDDPEFWSGGPSEPEPAEDPELPPPASLRDNPGACGCRLAGPHPPSPEPLSVFCAVGLIAGLLLRRHS